MKRLLTISLILSAFMVTGQIQPGARLLSGALNFSGSNSHSDFNSSNYSVTFNPGYSRFISEQKTLDVNLGYGYFRSDFTDDDNFRSDDNHQATAGLGFTHYKPLAERFYLSLSYGAGLGYGLRVRRSDDDATESINSLLAGARFNVGLAYFFGERWLVNADLGSVAYNLEVSADQWQHNYRLGAFVNNFSVRVSYFLDEAFSD